MRLITEKNIDDHDGAYAEIIGAHKNLSNEESSALNARLILILANHIGDLDILREALALAKQSN